MNIVQEIDLDNVTIKIDSTSGTPKLGSWLNFGDTETSIDLANVQSLIFRKMTNSNKDMVLVGYRLKDGDLNNGREIITAPKFSFDSISVYLVDQPYTRNVDSSTGVTTGNYKIRIANYNQFPAIAKVIATAENEATITSDTFIVQAAAAQGDQNVTDYDGSYTTINDSNQYNIKVIVEYNGEQREMINNSGTLPIMIY